MKSISGNKLSQIIEHKGWILKKATEKHHFYQKKGKKTIVSIPINREQSLKSETLKEIMKIAQILVVPSPKIH